ncbi:MAG: hypothetical protein IMZ71_00825, partial [Chloroflexi bacterium]|nr:hypothetical protein [Chloroflexota bacterium]
YKSTRQIIERIGLPSTYPALSTDATASAVSDTDKVSAAKVRILAWPAHDEGDAIALLMLQQLLDATCYEMEISPVGQRLSEILQEAEQKSPDFSFTAVCGFVIVTPYNV